jgi:hypothetical protein
MYTGISHFCNFTESFHVTVCLFEVSLCIQCQKTWWQSYFTVFIVLNHIKTFTWNNHEGITICSQHSWLIIFQVHLVSPYFLSFLALGGSVNLSACKYINHHNCIVNLIWMKEINNRKKRRYKQLTVSKGDCALF